MVADGDGEDLLGVILPDDESVQVVTNIFGLEVELADLLQGRFLSFGVFGTLVFLRAFPFGSQQVEFLGAE